MKRFFEKNHVGYYLLSMDIENTALEEWLVEERDSIQLVWSNQKFALFRKKT